MLITEEYNKINTGMPFRDTVLKKRLLNLWKNYKIVALLTSQ